MKRVLKWTGIVLGGIVVLMVAGLAVYASTAYEAEEAMYNAIDDLALTAVDVEEDMDEIRFTVNDPIANVVIIPGGLVDADAYRYLGAKLAEAGYDVTIFKTLFHLAILTPNYAARFLSDDLDNIVIGHSLGGTVGSIVASGDDRVSTVVLLGSYAFRDLSDKDVLLITGENDLVLDMDAYEEAKSLVSDPTEYEIQGGNHAGFGWYGEQDGDGDATITSKEQLDAVVLLILNHLSE